MGILNEMFGDGDTLPEAAASELLAEGDYVSEKQKMLSGYKEFRKRYVIKNLILRLFIVIIALASAVFMFVTSPTEDRMIPVFCVVLCVFIAVYFISQNIQNKKKYMGSLDGLSGIPYHVEIYTDKIKISDMTPVERAEKQEVSEETDTESQNGEKTAENPTTVIHLDSPIVDLLDDYNSYIIVVKKAYVFIIPKSAFTKEENEKVQSRFHTVMGIRYKCIYMPGSDAYTMELR